MRDAPSHALGYARPMNRRHVISMLGGAAVALPFAARAQQPMPVIGFLGVESHDRQTARFRGFHQGLSESGYAEGRTVTIEYRWSGGRLDQLPVMAADLVRRQVDVIAALSGVPAARAARAATTTIPVVFQTGGDLVELGLVASLSRPGGNLTGVSTLNAELGPKRLEVLHELLPAATVIALLVNPSNAVTEQQVRVMQTAARAFGVQVHVLNAAIERDFEAMFARVKELGASALLIANSAPVPMWVSTLFGTRAFANQAYLDFLGATYEDALVFDWRKILHPEDLPRILKEQVAGESSLKPFTLEARYRRADGEWRWIRSESQPRWDPTGKHIGFIGVAHDITVAKQAEIELRHLNESLSVQVARRTRERDRIWNVSQDLLLVLDQQGRWLSTNPAWYAATGWSEAELSSSDRPQILRQVCARLTQGLQTGKETRFDVQFPHRDGTSRWISWTGTIDDAVIYAVGRDVTREREAQETLRTTEEALRQSQKLEAMGQLTGGVAHDFNNLLMPIIGSLDMLQRRRIGGEREQRLIGGALQSADRAKTLVQRLLAFARRQPLQRVAVDVAELVAGMAQLIESTTGPQIHVVVDVTENVPLANADPNQLEMAILNLSVNARDAMTEGGTLRISASPEWVRTRHHLGLKPGRYVRISVADTGTGMDEAVLARAIEPFFSTKGVGKGTGLGLSMVHGLATQLGGSLSISSKPGLGTNVELWLPVSDTATMTSQTTPDSNEPSQATGTALLVDDDDMVRMSTADMLVELGFSVLEASSAEQALKIVDSGQPFDLLITDHLMPGMTGVDLSHAVRACRPGTPVLIISGFAEAEGIAPDLPRLTKPFRQAELAATISGLLL